MYNYNTLISCPPPHQPLPKTKQTNQTKHKNYTECRIKSLNGNPNRKSGFVCFLKTTISLKPTRTGCVKRRINFTQPKAQKKFISSEIKIHVTLNIVRSYRSTDKEYSWFYWTFRNVFLELKKMQSVPNKGVTVQQTNKPFSREIP